RLHVRLDDSKLSAAVAESEANFKLSESTYQRSKQLFEKTLVSQQEYDQAASVFEVNKATLTLKTRLLRDTRIFAPFAGIVASRHVSPGQVISKDTIITTLVGLDPVKVEINVPERFLGRLSIGQNIEMTVAAYPGKVFKGDVYFVTPSIDSLTRTALVKARIPNRQHELKPGMFANLDLTLQARENALVVPEPALIPSGDRVTLYVVNDQMEAQIRVVKIGVRMAGVVEILSGLNPGDKVIVEGIQKVRPGGKVKFAGAEPGSPYAAKPATTNATSPSR
ncbi:MAG: efflux RND transporter periplasmic adaptor subunit, partial [Opitutaceae bacterium]|nr:efflux RND transporter periplasmic adaptor subunit [Verrucomicrobiales bacterium]